MKDIQNNKATKMIAIIALILGGICLAVSFTLIEDINLEKNVRKMGFLLLAMAVVLGILSFQAAKRKKRGTRYHNVHWENGKITKDN